MRKPLVIFDMDGVLVDSEPAHMRLEQEMFARLSLSISEAAHEEFVGMSPRGMWSSIKARFGLPQEVEALMAMEAEVKLRAFGAMTLAAIDGVERLIGQLARDGCELAVASSSPQRLIETVTAALGIRHRFSHTVSAEEVPRGKPHPDVFLAVAECCGRAPADCVVIEDSGNGVRAALAAGMRCVAYAKRSSGGQDLSGADLVVHEFDHAGIERILALTRSTPAAPA